MIRRCECAVCFERKQRWSLPPLRLGPIPDSWGLPEGCDHDLVVKGLDFRENLIFFRQQGKPGGSVLAQPMVVFKELSDTGTPHCCDEGSLKAEKQDHDEWGDLEWDPTIRL